MKSPPKSQELLENPSFSQFRFAKSTCTNFLKMMIFCNILKKKHSLENDYFNGETQVNSNRDSINGKYHVHFNSPCTVPSKFKQNHRNFYFFRKKYTKF